MIGDSSQSNDLKNRILFTIINSKFGVEEESIIIMYSSSIASVLLSGYSYYYYLKLRTMFS